MLARLGGISIDRLVGSAGCIYIRSLPIDALEDLCAGLGPQLG